MSRVWYTEDRWEVEVEGGLTCDRRSEVGEIEQETRT